MCGGDLVGDLVDDLVIIDLVIIEAGSASEGGGSAYSPAVTSRLRWVITLRPLVGVWCSVHFGYYCYASKGDILVVKFSGS